MTAITTIEGPVDLGRMEFVGELSKLFPAYLAAQKGMGDLLKTSTNPGFKSKYADLAAVVEAVLPALHENGFALMQPPHSDGALVEVETILAHESGGYIRSTLGVRPSKQDPQGIGSAITYARRYALQSIAGIAPEDDDGNAASGPKPKAASAFEAASAKLRGITNGEIFKACWAQNKDGWKNLLSVEEYTRLVSIMKECASKFGAATEVDKPSVQPLGEDDIPEQFR